jgi:hypothetical protein
MAEQSWKRQKTGEETSRDITSRLGAPNRTSGSGGGGGGGGGGGDKNFGSLVSAAGEGEDWLKQEERFSMEQVRAGAELRVREGRGRPLDIVFFYLNLSNQSLTHTEKEKIPPPIQDPASLLAVSEKDKRA